MEACFTWAQVLAIAWNLVCHNNCTKLDHHSGYYDASTSQCQCTDPEPLVINKKIRLPASRHKGHFTVIESPNSKEDWHPAAEPLGDFVP